jgi:TolA-binding protein
MRDLGFGAEDVHKVEPLLVTYNAQGQVEGVKYDRVAVVLVNALKEQQAQVEQQRAQLAAQQTQIEELSAMKVENAKLKTQLRDIFARLEQLEKPRTTRR